MNKVKQIRVKALEEIAERFSLFGQGDSDSVFDGFTYANMAFLSKKKILSGGRICPGCKAFAAGAVNRSLPFGCFFTCILDHIAVC